MNKQTSEHDQLRVVVLISGTGSNLQAIIDAIESGELPNTRITAVISNRPNVKGLERASSHDIPAITLDHQSFDNRDSFDQALADLIDKYQPDLLVLAGFMRILTELFINRFEHRILNIHPSLLPKYKGLNTHQSVLASSDAEHGCTVHLVSSELDSGPIIGQAKFAIAESIDRTAPPNEQQSKLKQRVQACEHQLYPLCLRWFAEKRLVINGTCIEFDDQNLGEHGQQFIHNTLGELTAI